MHQSALIMTRIMMRFRRLAIGIVLVAGTMHPFAISHAGALGDGISGALDGYLKMAEEQRKANQQLEQQKQLLEYQMKLETERLQRQREYDEKRREEALRQQQQEQARRQELERMKADEEKRLAINTGTGFFIAPSGYLVTNSHVIEDKTDFAVRDYKGRFYRTVLVARDLHRDLALLKVSGQFPSLRIAHSDTVSKGQHVFAVGYPQIAIQGNESKVTDGIISSFSGIRNDDDWFQISVPIQGGNSGGPLVTESGNVVGVVVASVSISKFYAKAGTLPQNVNYAIKSKLVLDFLTAHGVKNFPSATRKVGLETVDSATAMVIAKNGPIDVAYERSPERQVEDVKARKAAEVVEKGRVAEAAAEAARLRKEQLIADQRQREEVARISKRDREISKAFPDWKEVLESNLFNAWLRSQPAELDGMASSAKSSEVLAVMKRYQLERHNFAETYFNGMGAWIADATGCKFLDPKPIPTESIRWNGKCEQGRGTGEGELVWLATGEPKQKFTGTFKDGMLNGVGRVEIVGKEYQEGTFQNGKLEGRGKFVRTGETPGEYEGSFKAGKPDGLGKLVLKDSWTYEGSFRDGKFNGFGKLTIQNGGKFEGKFVDGKKDGAGLFTAPDGRTRSVVFAADKLVP